MSERIHGEQPSDASRSVAQPARAEERPPALEPGSAEILALQQTAGNRAVRQLIQRLRAESPDRPVIRRWSREQILEQVPNPPDWATDETGVRSMQVELRRLGLYNLGRDGDYGRGTDAALVEAFGGDEFRTLDAAAVLERLRAARALPGRRGQHSLRYGEMFRDGVLDMTVGIGYDEYLERNPTEEVDSIRAALEAREFVQNNEAALALYRQAGRDVRPSLADMYFVRRDALTYQPPAAAPRSIHAVIRLVSNPSGTRGAEAAEAFREGMVESDVAYYAGHGRYGTGPDFDRNFASFVLHNLDDPAQTEPPILDYDVLEQRLKQEVRQRRLGRSAFQQFLWRQEQGLIDVNFTNAGNLRINPRNLHRGEFGSDLMNWALNEGHVQPETGEGGRLAAGAAAHPERRYRVLVFDGCRTSDYETSVRSTPGFDRRSTRTIETTRTVLGSDDAAVLGAFLDSILGRQSAEQIVQGMDAAQGNLRAEEGSTAGTFRGQGSSLEPTVR